MSSSLKLKKICEYCSQKFIAKKSTTRFCSHRCNSRSYKENVREQKKTNAEQELIFQTQKPTIELSSIQVKQFLDIKETCVLLKCSESTLRKLISKRSIPSFQIGRKHIIRRTDIDSLFE